jgi:hypothetical protein
VYNFHKLVYIYYKNKKRKKNIEEAKESEAVSEEEDGECGYIGRGTSTIPVHITLWVIRLTNKERKRIKPEYNPLICEDLFDFIIFSINKLPLDRIKDDEALL